MGFLDRAKAQAEQTIAKAQQGMAQGQTKLDQMQAKRKADSLLHELGVAYYAQSRHGGSAEAVSLALAALDAFSVEQGPIDSTASPAGTNFDGTNSGGNPTSSYGTVPPLNPDGDQSAQQ